jgi:hypothetical protein
MWYQLKSIALVACLGAVLSACASLEFPEKLEFYPVKGYGGEQ